MDAELFAELQRRAPEIDCKIIHAPYAPEQVNVYYQDEAIGILSDSLLLGFPGYTEKTRKNDAYHKMQALINEVREYVRAYQNGGYPAYAQLPEGYRALTNYNLVFLAAKKMEFGGYQFVTWQLEKGKMSFCDGKYTTNFKVAKMDYVRRTRLLDYYQLFSDPQLQAIQKAVQYTLENQPDMGLEFSEQLQRVSLQLAYELPEADNQNQGANGFEQTL